MSMSALILCMYTSVGNRKLIYVSYMHGFAKLTEKIEKCKREASEGGSTQSNISNLAEFDPMANILQLEYQAKQMRHLLDNPLKIQADISLVNSVDGIEGRQQLT